MDEIGSGVTEITCDVLVIGGGTAGPMAAYKARMNSPKARVVLLEKANVKRSGAIAMGMDGLNNAVIPGYSSPEQYTKEITIANDGVCDQAPVLKYAQRCYTMIQELDRFGIRFLKDGNGEFAVRKVHHLGSYVLPMPNGDTVKKALYRQLRRAQVLISNRFMATRLLRGRGGRIAGAIAVNTRNAEFLVLRAKAVILCAGAAGRLGLPASGYLFGTYENAANSGDGYAMAYHAGAALANLECFQINPLIKDYNGPACAYVCGPFGGYTANNRGERFIQCDYWSGQMMLEFWNELQSGKGPVFLKLDHLHESTIGEIESILHRVERPSRGRFHEARGTDYRRDMVEMHVSEIGFCSGHSASGVFVDSCARTTVDGLYAAGDMASVPHNYMLGAFTNGAVAGEHAVGFAAEVDHDTHDPDAVRLEQERVLAPTRREDGIPANQIEYKVRRLVNDYLQPPKVTRKMQIFQHRIEEAREDLETGMLARDAHELMRAMEASSILDCAEMAAAASLFRTESRWGLYHLRVEYPERDDANWLCHTLLRRVGGKPVCEKRPVAPYLVPIAENERDAYHQQRINA
ncbi:MAG: fumarate reductase/succinate dehydrogenase flavoprotein subunit [Acetobacteraceae bacterium]|nr:fumarate reductase/succinate dehydrogenase flavoprotein subunit [Acetobacteraceae bacterium]